MDLARRQLARSNISWCKLKHESVARKMHEISIRSINDWIFYISKHTWNISTGKVCNTRPFPGPSPTQTRPVSTFGPSLWMTWFSSPMLVNSLRLPSFSLVPLSFLFLPIFSLSQQFPSQNSLSLYGFYPINFSPLLATSIIFSNFSFSLFLQFLFLSKPPTLQFAKHLTLHYVSAHTYIFGTNCRTQAPHLHAVCSKSRGSLVVYFLAWVSFSILLFLSLRWEEAFGKMLS